MIGSSSKMKWSPPFKATTHENFANLDAFVNEQQSQSRYVFSRQEMVQAVQLSESGLHKAIRRLVKEKRLVVLHRDVYLIVPLEYRAAGTLPPSWFIDLMMEILQRPYYVGLLSAATLHGAYDEPSTEYHVITQTPLRATQTRNTWVRFFVKHETQATPCEQIQASTGSIWVSTPEATALDLVRYADRIGGIPLVAAVLGSLQTKIKEKRLLAAISQGVELAVVQRLGYLLSILGNSKLASVLALYVEKQHPKPVRLSLEHPAQHSPKDSTFGVFVNLPPGLLHPR